MLSLKQRGSIIFLHLKNSAKKFEFIEFKIKNFKCCYSDERVFFTDIYLITIQPVNGRLLDHNF